MASWTNLSTSQKVAVTVGVSAGAAVLYIWYSKYRNGQALGVPEQDVCELRMKIPQHGVRLLTERATTAGKLLVAHTEADVRLDEWPDMNGERELTIAGSATQVRQAQQLVCGMLQDRTVIEVDLQLPARSMCRVIGKRGERIQEIRKLSGASIDCEQKAEADEVATSKRITVSGTREQVAAAQSLIHRASEKEAPGQRRDADSPSFRSHRKEIIAVKKKDVRAPEEAEERGPASASSPHTEDSAGESPSHPAADSTYNVCRFQVPSPGVGVCAEERVQVYVSAVQSPERFWMQILGPRWSQLDKLTTEMSAHYGSREQGVAAAMQVGDIVAAQFLQDDSWYRAQVLGLLDGGSVDLYYVDYGDNWEAPREKVFPLRSDFLSLPFQAIECSLAGVSPAGGGAWSEEALNAFDELTHCAQWEPLLAKISSFPSPGITCCFQVRLYDPAAQSMMDVGEELIRRGFAVRQRLSAEEEEEESSSAVPRLLEEVLSAAAGPEVCSFAGRQERRHASGDSIEVVRADADPPPDGVLSPPAGLDSAGDGHSLEQSLAKIQLSGSSSATSASSPPSDSSAQSSGSSGTGSSVSSASSACTVSEGVSFVSSSCEDSSVYSPRGCFYYMPDPASSTSSSPGDVITISSDSEEEEAATAPPEARRRAGDSDVFLSSASDDVVVVDDD